MGARGAKPQYATPYGAYGPKVGQIPNPAIRAPTAAPRPYNYAPAYTAAPAVASPAAALDAADGVIDGRYFGSPIVGAAAPTYAYAAPTYTAAAYSAPVAAFGGYAPTYTGYGYGAPVYSGATYGAAYAAPAFAAPAYAAPAYGATNAALALDAADGVIDGRYFGAQIAQPATSYAAAPYAPAYYGGFY